LGPKREYAGAKFSGDLPEEVCSPKLPPRTPCVAPTVEDNSFGPPRTHLFGEILGGFKWKVPGREYPPGRKVGKLLGAPQSENLLTFPKWTLWRP